MIIQMYTNTLISNVAKWARKMLDVFLYAMIIKENGGNIVTLQLESVIHHDVVFNETSSWWSMKKEILPDQTDLNNKFQIAYFELSEDVNVEQGATHNFGQ